LRFPDSKGESVDLAVGEETPGSEQDFSL
jgi:hypothetical protein